MGLDMYLEKFPRLGLTPTQLDVAESYFEWEAHNQNKPEDKCTFEEWVGVERAKHLLAKSILNVLKNHVKTVYYAWDSEHNYPHNRISQSAAYWRKANQIHNWFVENLQDGVDDCEYHEEFTKEKVEELLDICTKIKKGCAMRDGQIIQSYSYDKDGNRVNNYADGKVMTNPSIAEELLPTQSGFFFGGTEYDECYMEDIDSTIDQLTTILETTDFENEAIYYRSSW